MATLHIHAPRPDMRGIDRNLCQTCNRRTYMVWWHTPYCGIDCVCLHCGERWQDGEQAARPFVPRWRQKSIAEAKAYWRRFRDVASVSLIAGKTPEAKEKTHGSD